MKMIAMIAAILAAGPALAQKQGPTAPPEKINLPVLVYGNQPCPKQQGDEIVVCSPDEPYRLPKVMRGDPLALENQSWANRTKDIANVGSTGPQSCSAVGPGGFGCPKEMINQFYAARKFDESIATSLVEAERGKRLGKIDAESAAIEAQAKLDEAAAKAPSAGDAAPPR